MNPENIQQEILFYTGTTFAQKELSSAEPLDRSASSKTDKFENAFWNGLLFELLPELKVTETGSSKLYLWQINSYGAYMRVTLCNSPGEVDYQHSMDPYLFFNESLKN